MISRTVFSDYKEDETTNNDHAASQRGNKFKTRNRKWCQSVTTTDRARVRASVCVTGADADVTYYVIIVAQPVVPSTQ